MKLKVYSLKARGNYCWGMAVVAAQDADEAMKLAELSCSNYFPVRYHWSDVKELPVKYSGVPVVLDHDETGE